MQHMREFGGWLSHAYNRLGSDAQHSNSTSENTRTMPRSLFGAGTGRAVPQMDSSALMPSVPRIRDKVMSPR